MKDQCYETEVCFSQSSLVLCGCQCPCGSRNDGKIACVHTFVPMLQMSYLLLDGFLEHAICEIAARWQTAPPEIDKDERVCGTLAHLMCLVDAKKYFALMNSMKAVSQMLDSFHVGTKRPQAMPVPPPFDQIYQPIRFECSGRAPGW